MMFLYNLAYMVYSNKDSESFRDCCVVARQFTIDLWHLYAI